MYKRKIERVLSAWKEKPGRKPLIINGCRQCGKTSSVCAFAVSNYKYVIYLNFHEHKQYKQFFMGDLDTDTITMNIMAGIPNTRIEPHNTCFIFDEVQDCPAARSSLKFFKLDGRYDVICTGSLLGVSGYKSDDSPESNIDYSIPVGFETIVDMYPMDFEEWLWANGLEQLHFDYLSKCYADETPVNDAMHTRLRQLFLQYIVVGGMPEAVSTWMQTHNMSDVIEVQSAIISSYKDDMIKYAKHEDKVRIRECFESIPAQLSRENRKFQYSVVRKGGRSSDYISSLQWIEDAGIVNRCYNLLMPELPLAGNAIKEEFKVYMADTGLFVSMLEEGTQWSIMNGNLYTYKGAIFENAVADILSKKGRKLYYLRKTSGLELDFVTRMNDECVPLECKATTGNAKSLKTVLAHSDKYHISRAIKLGDYNIGRTGGILTIPMYMAYLL